jgi:hypothetical protein
MLQSVYNLRNNRVCAQDGTIGHVDQFLFDDRTGKARYVVVRFGGWLLGRRVLLKPELIGTMNVPLGRLDVALSRKQIEDCPDIETHPPVSLQHASAYRYDNAAMLGCGMFPSSLLVGMSWYPIQSADEARAALEDVLAHSDAHLRSTREVIGYRLQARDGAIGHIVDFIIDESTWTFRSVVVDTGTWRPGKRVVLPWQRIEDINWDRSTVEVRVLRSTVKQHPIYDLARLRQQDHSDWRAL